MEETIDLREIIKIIINGKRLIIICTIVAMLIAGILSWFVLEEKYESEAIVQVSADVQDMGVLSNFISTEFAPNIYLQRMGNIEQNKKFFEARGYTEYNKKNLNVFIDPNTNLVNLTYKGTSPKEAQELLTLLMDKTKSEINSSVKTSLDQLERTYLSESSELSTEIEELMSKYNKIVVSNNLPEVLILQTIASSQFVLNLSTEQTKSLSSITGTLQNELLQLKVQIDTKSTEYKTVLSKYQSVKTGIASFKPDPFIRVIVDPTLDDDSTLSSKLIKLAIGLLVGMMIGFGWVFMRAYWKKISMD